MKVAYGIEMVVNALFCNNKFDFYCTFVLGKDLIPRGRDPFFSLSLILLTRL